ncbi:MAG: LysE family transporter [Desulfobacteraceae bacterium]|nr:LysE family transporter [Desulfobacteraceae bacterium]
MDTVLLLGSLAAHFAHMDRFLFFLSAVTASFAWFYGLGYGSRILDPIFRKPIVWRILDVVVGGTMWIIGINPIRYGLAGGK